LTTLRMELKNYSIRLAIIPNLEQNFLKVMEKVIKFSGNFFRRLLRIWIFLKARAIIIAGECRNPWRWYLSSVDFFEIDSSEPFVFLYSFSVIDNAKSQSNVRVKKLSDDIFAFYVKESRELDHSVDDLAVNTNRLVIIERWIAREHFKNQYSKRPPINSLSIPNFSSFDDFRSEVFGRSAESKGTIALIKLFSKSEICDF